MPSRDRDVEPACAETAPWIKALQHGDVAPFEMMLQAAKWTRPVGRWVRLLLLISGDVENLGPLPREYQPRGELDLFGGLSRATPDVRSGLGDRRDGQFDFPSVWANAVRLWVARYQLVYTITAVQRLRPEFKSLLGGAWHVDRIWQLEQPGQCRAVLSAPILRAVLTLALLWGGSQFVGVIAIWFAGMLHPNEFIQLIRQDVVLPEDALLKEEVMYIHINSPKTARFARRQHAKIDDASITLLVRCLFGALPLHAKLFGASMAVFRRQWN